MDRYVERLETAENQARRQAGNKLKVIQINCGYKGIAESHHVKCVELRNYLHKNQPDIVLLQETWLKKKSTVSFPGYAVLRKDRPEDYGRAAGGVATLIRKDAGISYDQIMEEIAPMDECSDVLVAKVSWYHHSFILSNIYNPPFSTRPTGRPAFTANTLTACLNKGPNQIIAGDFNAHSSMWDARENIIPNQDGEAIEEWITSNNVQCANNGEPTYTCKISRRKYAIDLTFQSGNMKVCDWRTIPEPSFSDHACASYALYWDNLDRADGEVPRERTKPKITKFCYEKADWSRFNRVFAEVYKTYKDAERVGRNQQKIKRFRTNEVEIENRRITESFRKAMKTIPQGCRQDPVPWWDDELDEAIFERTRLKEIRDSPVSIIPIAERQEAYQVQARRVQQLILSKRRDTWQKFATDHLKYTAGPKRTASMIKHLTREPRVCGDQILKDKYGGAYEQDREKARAYLRQFALVSKRELKPLVMEPDGHTRAHYYRSARREQATCVRGLRQKKLVRESLRANEPGAPTVSMFELRSALGMLHTGRAAGIDRVSNEMIKNLNRINLGRIHKLINLSFATGYVPTAWKLAKLHPLLKSGKDPKFVESYRPISLLECVGKLMERIVVTRLEDEVERRQLLPHSQAGFRRWRSTEDPLLDIVSDLHDTRACRGNKDLLVILLDFEKAFDRVDPWILLKIMQDIGLPTYLLRWYRGFLMDRRYCVCVGTSYSKVVRFALGVPQGSISGPLLFALYLSTLTKEIRSVVPRQIRTVEYADDVNIWVRLDRTQDNRYDTGRAQLTLDTISNWSERYGINVSISQDANETKTYGFLLLANQHEKRPPPPISLRYRDTALSFKTEFKMLGVTFDNNLNFEKHVKDVTDAAKRKLACISKIVGKDWGGSTGDTRAACLSQVWPILTYACNVWGPLLTERTITTLRRTANYMARVITGMFRPTNTDSLYLEANMLDIMKTVEDKTMAGIERHRRRPDGDPLQVKALGTTPRVRASKVYHNKCWQQSADHIQERYLVYTRRRLIDKTTGELKSATDYTKLAVTAAAADIAFLHRAPLDDPSNTIRPDAATDVLVRFYPQLVTPVSASTSAEDKLRSATETIDQLRRNVRGAIWELWTDGAVRTRTGAGAAQLYIGQDEQPKWTECAPAGNCTDSFATESLAVLIGLAKIAKMRRPGVNKQVIVVYTDSLALVTALQSGPIRQRDVQIAAIWRSVYTIYRNGAKRISFQWIPSHCGVPRNVRVDAAAGQALAQYGSMTQRKVPVRYQNIVSYYKEKSKAYYLSVLQRQQPFRASITTAPANLKNDNALGRRAQAKLAQLRSGVCNTMGYYQRLAADHFRPDYNRRCRWCGLQDETVQHVYNECDDLQIGALRDGLRATTGWEITTECLVRDPNTALIFHDQALSYLRH